MVTRLFIAMQAIKQAFIYQVVLNILLIAAIWICTMYYGEYGYPYGVIIINGFNVFAMYFICRLLVPFIDYAALLKYTGIIILINAVIVAGLHVALLPLKAYGPLVLVLGFLVYLIILLLLNKKFKLNTELGQILHHVTKDFFKRWYIKIARYIFRQKFLPVIAGPLEGFRWSTSSPYEYILGNYEDPETQQQLLSWLRPGTVFYDIGSNVGFHALLAGRVMSNGTIYAFEPMPAVREILEQHISLNKKMISGSHIRVLPVAIADREKEVEFSNDLSHRDGNTYIPGSYVFAGTQNKIKVSAIQ
ncbi:MAG: FkbM family methyltransferase [Chitinophagaceae bacterium]|nr:FkbM family methyltransferase [Chitinophagaceae bacterium]